MIKKNIYITKDERQQLRRIQQKYCLSLSAIINQIIHPIYQLALRANNLDYLYNKKTFNGYGKYKTSIKTNKYWIPRKQDQKESDAVLLTNTIKCYLYNDYKRIINDDKLIIKCKNQIEDNLNKAYDPYWNYNDVLRANMKFWKENPQYKGEKLNNEPKGPEKKH